MNENGEKKFEGSVKIMRSYAVIKEADDASYQASRAYDYEDEVPW